MPTLDRERPTPVRHISACPLGEEFPGLSMQGLAYFAQHPEHPQMQEIETACPGIPNGHGGRTPCPDSAAFQCRAYFSAVTVCERCRDTYDQAERISRLRKAWEHVCPAAFRDTDKTHAGFPRVQFESLKGWDGGSSLFFYGPSGQGKTRLAMLMLKRAMLRGQVVGVLWPERLRSLTQGYDSATFDHYALFDVLLLDDVFVTACRESKLVDAVKQLVDVRLREKRATIITTQVAGESDLAGGKEFGEAKAADLERLNAIFRRTRESYQLVAFATATPAQGEAQY